MFDFGEFINAILSNVIIRLFQGVFGRMNKRILPTLSHYTIEAVRRRHQGLPFCFYECRGGIITPLPEPDSALTVMDDVPDEIYEEAVTRGTEQAKLGGFPNFDFKIKGAKYIYRVYASTVFFHSHTLAFYRRPRLFV